MTPPSTARLQMNQEGTAVNLYGCMEFSLEPETAMKQLYGVVHRAIKEDDEKKSQWETVLQTLVNK